MALYEAVEAVLPKTAADVGEYVLTGFHLDGGSAISTYGLKPAPNDTQSEIDRLRERIRFLEQDVERALSSIAELSTGGKGFWQRPEKPAEPIRARFYRGI